MLHYRIFLFNEIHYGGPCSPKFYVKQIKPGAGAVGTNVALDQLLKQSLMSHYPKGWWEKAFSHKILPPGAGFFLLWSSLAIKRAELPQNVWRAICAWRRKPIFLSFLEIPRGKLSHILLQIIPYPWLRYQLYHQDVIPRELQCGIMVFCLAKTLLQLNTEFYHLNVEFYPKSKECPGEHGSVGKPMLGVAGFWREKG